MFQNSPSSQSLHPTTSHGRCRRGAGSLEGSLLLASLAIVLALTVVTAGPLLRRHAQQIPTVLAQGGAATTVHEEAASESPRIGGNWAYSALILAATIVAVLGMWLQSRRPSGRPAACPAETPAPAEPVLPEQLQIRSFGKRQQLWRALLTDGELLLKNGLEARHLMTLDPLSVGPERPVREIRRIMDTERVHHLLVCEGLRVLGVVNEADLCTSGNRRASEIMQPPRAVAPHTSLSAVIQTLIEKNLSCLPVVEDGCLCGVVTTTDLVLTLQCSLQLWLRMAQAANSGDAWLMELQRLMKVLQSEAAVQQQQVGMLGELLAAEVGGPEAEQADNAAFARRASDFVELTQRLAEQIDSSQQRLRRYAQQWIRLSDLRLDETTGLANQRELDSVLELLLAMHRRYGQPFSLVAVKAWGEADESPAGREAATERRKAAARLIVQCTRSSDLAAALAGDVFAVVLTQTPHDGAAIFCRRLQAAADAESIRSRIDLCLGVADSCNGDTPSSLLERAVSQLAAATEAITPGPGAPVSGSADIAATPAAV